MCETEQLGQPRVVWLLSSVSSTSTGSWICLAKLGKNVLPVNSETWCESMKKISFILQSGTKTAGLALSPQTHLELPGHYHVTVLKG